MRWARAIGVLLLAGCGGVEVRGFVRDGVTGEPLPGAEIRVDGETTHTDSAGHYATEVDVGEPHHVYVASPGYHPESAFVVAEGKGRYVHDLYLIPASLPRTEEAR